MITLLLALSVQCADGTPPPCRVAARPAAARPNSVAVLYFENNSPDTSDVYLADGLTEELITQLGRINRLSVSSRTSVRRYRGAAGDPASAARGLNVSHLLTGGVRRAGTRLRVDVELLRMPGEQRLWGESYQRTDGDLFAIQEEIARQVTRAVAGTLLPAERTQLSRAPTRDPAAYDLYLRASQVFSDVSPRSLQRAIALIDSALARDPGFAAARGRLAYTLGWAANWRISVPGIPADSMVAHGLRVVERALREDPASSDAWMGRSFLLFFSEPPDYQGAIEAGQRAVSLDSTSGLAHENLAVVLRRVGRFAEAERSYRAAIATERRPQSMADMGFIELTHRRYAASAAWYDSAAILLPANWSLYIFRARGRLGAGDAAGARSDALAAVQFADSSTRHIALATRASIEGRLGDTAAARALIEPVYARFASGPISVREGYELVAGLVGAGQRDRALDVLERIRPRGAWLWSYLVFDDFDPIRSDPRFQRVFAESRPPGAPSIP